MPSMSEFGTRPVHPDAFVRPNRPICLDHHSTTPCAPEVRDAMWPYFGERFGNPSAINHARGRAAAERVAQARSRIAALLGTIPEAVVLTAGASEANNLAIIGAARRAPAGRDEIAISAIEHPSVRAAAERMRENGFRVVELPVTTDGFVDPEAAATHLSARTALVSVMAANHEIGTIQPIAAMAAAAHRVGALFHSDATQAVGKIPLDMDRDGVDLLSLSGHKFYGPPGIGALLVRQQPPVALDPIILGGGQNHGLRSGTVPLALAVGLAEACDLAARCMADDAERLDGLSRRLLTALRNAGLDVAVNGSLQRRLPGSLNLRFRGVDAADLLLDLADDLCLATGSACASGASAPSRVLKAIGLSGEDCAASIRLSLGRASGEAEVEFAAERLTLAVAQYRPLLHQG